MKVASILKRKGADVVTVKPEATVAEAARELRVRGIGALVVSEDGRTMWGVVSERDIVHGLAVYGAGVLGLRVSDLMERRVVTCAADASITAVMEDMTRHRVRHIPVMEGRELRGMGSIGDVVKHRLEELETEASVLRDVVIARR